METAINIHVPGHLSLFGKEGGCRSVMCVQAVSDELVHGCVGHVIMSLQVTDILAGGDRQWWETPGRGGGTIMFAFVDVVTATWPSNN